MYYYDADEDKNPAKCVSTVYKWWKPLFQGEVTAPIVCKGGSIDNDDRAVRQSKKGKPPLTESCYSYSNGVNLKSATSIHIALYNNRLKQRKSQPSIYLCLLLFLPRR